MTRKIEYINGEKIGALIFLQDVNTETINRKAKFQCQCGKIFIAQIMSVKSWHTLSCGCVKRKRASEANKTHGFSDFLLYDVWTSIKQRCYNKNNKGYKNYGARGINMCDEWREDVKEFINWCLNNGYKEGLHIDRIDNTMGYEPYNCRFITQKENNRNKRNNRLIIINGETKCLIEWIECLNLNKHTFDSRINNGWDVKKALSTPVRKYITSS
jgi:hypothetical protein